MLIESPSPAIRRILFAVCVFAVLSSLSIAAESAPDTQPAPPAPAAEAPTVQQAEPLTVSIERAIMLAMENNRSLVVQKMDPDISRTFEDEERAVFDSRLSGQASQRRSVADRLSRAGSGIESSTVDSVNGVISLDKLFPTGTAVGLDATTSYTDSSLYSDTFVSNRLGASVTQALLQGRDVRVNMARINQAAIDTQISEYELRGFTEVLAEDRSSQVSGTTPWPSGRSRSTRTR